MKQALVLAEIRSRSAVLMAVMVAGASLAGAVLAPPASALMTDMACTGSQQNVFTSTGFTYSGFLAPCLSSDPAVISGTFSGTAQGSGGAGLGCILLAAGGSRSITWNTGETTSLVTQRTVPVTNPFGILLIATGVVTGGKFKGDTVTLTQAGISPTPLACLLQTPQSSINNTITLTLSHL
jgi:hypothetical protein